MNGLLGSHHWKTPAPSLGLGIIWETANWPRPGTFPGLYNIRDHILLPGNDIIN